MELKKELVLRDIAGDFVLIPTGTTVLENNGLFTINEVAARTWSIDLVLSGHAHGGQVVLPVLGGVFGGDLGLFSPYLHGMCRKDGLTMAVTSGLGSQRERLPRFHNPPEIMVIDLTPES